MKSQKSIQNRPSSARCVHSSLFRLGGQLGQLSDQGPVQEKRPQGFLSCSSLKEVGQQRVATGREEEEEVKARDGFLCC